jgi:hypothetical protein
MSKMRVMKSMELSDDKKLDYPFSCDYPCGLKICLTNDELQALDLDSESASVDGIVHLHAHARITHVSHSDGPDGYCCRVELQIEDMCIDSDDDDDYEDDHEEY